ncbi:hypothetical protein IKG29_02875 [Candidatus Saccharibacteria bacterium]|nr:hypothetical protein [Candidatus Saccharibacteria bacterium]
MPKSLLRQELKAGKPVARGNSSSPTNSNPAVDPVIAAWDEVRRLQDAETKLQASAKEAKDAASSCEKQLVEKQAAYVRLYEQANADWDRANQAQIEAEEAISKANQAQTEADEAIFKVERSVALAKQAAKEHADAKQAHAESQDALAQANSALEACRSELEAAKRAARSLQREVPVPAETAGRGILVVDEGGKPSSTRFEQARRSVESLKLVD